jgi:hypothetical protein
VQVARETQDVPERAQVAQVELELVRAAPDNLGWARVA